MTAPVKAALLQITSTDQPEDNLGMTRAMVAEAAGQGAGFVLTPEVSNCLSNSRAHQREVLCMQDDDPVLAGLRAQAAARRHRRDAGSNHWFVAYRRIRH